MEARDRRKPFFDRLKEGLEDAVRHAKGEITLKSTTLSTADRHPELDSEDVAVLRAESGLSQAEFARVLNVSTKTVRGWERGTQRPSAAAQRLIQVFRHDPEGVLLVAGMNGGR